MGGNAAHITLLPIRKEGSSTGQTALEATYDAFSTFDANAAKCFKPEDKEALLGVIESGTGSIDAFNATVHEIFASRRMAESTRDKSHKNSGAPAAAESRAEVTRVNSSRIEVLTVQTPVREGRAVRSDRWPVGKS